MGRFTVKVQHEIAGTGHRVYLTPLSALSLGNIQSSSFSSLGSEDGADAKDAEAKTALKRTAEVVAANTWEDEALTTHTFASAAEAEEELTFHQLQDLFVAIMRLSSMGPEAVATARRFPDGKGEAGGVDDSPDGREVRAAAGGSAGG